MEAALRGRGSNALLAESRLLLHSESDGLREGGSEAGDVLGVGGGEAEEQLFRGGVWEEWEGGLVGRAAK